MTATIIDGKAIAAQIRSEVAERVQGLQEPGRDPGPGRRPRGRRPRPLASTSAPSTRPAADVGIRSEQVDLPAFVTEDNVLATIRRLNRDPEIHGIIVQLPVPGHLKELPLQMAIDPEKDVDGLHPMNVGMMVRNDPTFPPATPYGIVELLLRSGIQLEGQEVVVVGYGELVGAPLSIMLTQDSIRGNATVTCCHIRTRDLGRAHAPRRHPGGGGRRAAADHRRHGQAGRHRRRRRCASHGRRPGGRRAVRGGRRGGRRHHAGAGRRRSHDRRHAAREHRRRRRGRGVRAVDPRRRRRPARRDPSRPAVRRDGRDRAAALRERRRGDRARTCAGGLDRRGEHHRQPHGLRAHVAGGGRLVRGGRRHRAHAAARRSATGTAWASRPSCWARGPSARATCCACPAIRSRSATIPTRRW